MYRLPDALDANIFANGELSKRMGAMGIHGNGLFTCSYFNFVVFSSMCYCIFIAKNQDRGNILDIIGTSVSFVALLLSCVPLLMPSLETTL